MSDIVIGSVFVVVAVSFAIVLYTIYDQDQRMARLERDVRDLRDHILGSPINLPEVEIDLEQTYAPPPTLLDPYYSLRNNLTRP